MKSRASKSMRKNPNAEWPIPRPSDNIVKLAHAFREKGRGDPYKVAEELAAEIIRLDTVISMTEDGL